MADLKKYTKRENVLLLVFLLVSIAGFLFFWKFGDHAFQQFDIRFKITRDQAATKSTDFAKEMGFSTDGYKKLTVFDTESGKEYLEKEVGVTDTSKMAENDVAIWDFATRFVRPLQKEEFTVKYLPNGRLVGFSHLIDENKKGEFINVENARVAAEAFLTSKVGANLSDWYLVSSESTKKQNRTDTMLTYEKSAFRANDATYRMTVGLAGDEVTSYREFVKVPEAWERNMTNETSKSFLSQSIVETLYFLLFIIPAIILFFIRLRKTNFRYNFALIVCGLFFVIYLLNGLNTVSLALFGYGTTQSWSSFVGSVAMISVFSALIETISLFFVLIVGEALYREAFPQKMALEKIFTKHGLRTKTVNFLMIAGVCLAFCMMLYEVIYYFLGSKIGFWAPAEINYSNMYSTYAPWAYPLMIGFIAAVSEEVAFRLFGITFLKKFLKNTWVAIIISAMVWGFLHSSYTQIPWFVRGIELSIVGIGFGLIYVRFGLIPSIIAHFTFNAFITAISYLSSGNWYVIISSMLVALLPAIIALIIYVRSRTQNFTVDPKDLANQNIRLENKLEPAIMASNVAPSIFQPLTSRYKLVLPILAIIGLVIGSVLYLRLNPGIKPTTIDASDAIKIATNIAKDEAIPVSELNAVANYGSATPVSNFTESNPSSDTEAASESLQKTYLTEKGGWSANKKFYEKIPANIWSVRFYKDLQKEEYIVDLLPDGSYYRLTKILDETTPGYIYTEEQAVQVATEFATTKGLLTDFKLIDVKSEKRDQREDFKITFEENGGKIGDATFRTSVTILGKDVAGFEQYYKIPDVWIRDHEKRTTSDFILYIIIGAAIIGLVVLCVIAFIRALKNGQINFKRTLLFAIILVGFDLLSYFNGFNSVYFFYDTTMPFWRYFLMDFFFLSFGISLVLSVVLAFAVEMGVSLWSMILFNAKTNKSRFKSLLSEGLIVGFSLPLVLFGIEQIVSLVALKLNRLDLITDSVSLINTSAVINTYLPFFTQLSSSLSLLAAGCFFSFIVLVVYLYTRKWLSTILIFLGLTIIFSIPGQRSLVDGLIMTGENIVAFGILGLVIWKVLRKNPISYIVAIWTSVALPLAFQLLFQKASYYQLNGWLVILVALLPITVYFGNYAPSIKIKKLLKWFRK